MFVCLDGRSRVLWISMTSGVLCYTLWRFELDSVVRQKLVCGRLYSSGWRWQRGSSSSSMVCGSDPSVDGSLLTPAGLEEPRHLSFNYSDGIRSHLLLIESHFYRFVRWCRLRDTLNCSCSLKWFGSSSLRLTSTGLCLVLVLSTAPFFVDVFYATGQVNFWLKMQMSPTFFYIYVATCKYIATHLWVHCHYGFL